MKLQSILSAAGFLGIIVLLLVMFVGAGSMFGGLFQSSEIRARISQWHKSKPESYPYIVRPSCFCPIASNLSYLVVIDSEGVSTSVEEQWGFPYAGTQVKLENVMTIDRVFELLTYAIPRADEVRVEYDDRFGFPTRIRIDNHKSTTDDEYQIEVVEFKEGASDI